jgi:hypothetical protein
MSLPEPVAEVHRVNGTYRGYPEDPDNIAFDVHYDADKS